jgi:hypothetical protein
LIKCSRFANQRKHLRQTLTEERIKININSLRDLLDLPKAFPFLANFILSTHQFENLQTYQDHQEDGNHFFSYFYHFLWLKVVTSFAQKLSISLVKSHQLSFSQIVIIQNKKEESNIYRFMEGRENQIQEVVGFVSGYVMPRTEPSSYTAGKVNRKRYEKDKK